MALETNRSEEALAHFREALRLDPTSDFARSGLVEALKARYWVYRTFMRFIYWTSSLSAGLRRGLFLGAYVVARVVPALWSLFLAFAYLSWFSDVLFESLLRLNRYGSYALSAAQRRHSNHFLALLGIGVAARISALVWPAVPGLRQLCFVVLGLLFPLVGTEQLSHRPEQRARSRWAGWTLASVGLLSVALSLLGLSDEVTHRLYLAFLFGTLAYTWVFALR